MHFVELFKALYSCHWRVDYPYTNINSYTIYITTTQSYGWLNWSNIERDLNPRCCAWFYIKCYKMNLWQLLWLFCVIEVRWCQLIYAEVGDLFESCDMDDNFNFVSSQIRLLNSLLCRPSKTAQPLVCADRPKPPSKLTVRGPFVYRDHILLLH